MTYPDASPTELKVPIRTYVHPDAGSTVTFVGTHHPARRAYYQEITTIINFLQDGGAYVYFEHVDDPTPEQLAAAPKELREAVELAATRLDNNNDAGAEMGLVKQSAALPWRERGWQVHDVTTLEMAEAFGQTVKTVKQESQKLKINNWATRRMDPYQRDLGRMRIFAMNLAHVTGAVGISVLLDPGSRRFAEMRERLVLKALDDQRTATPDADFVLVWGASHLIGIGQGLTERGYKPETETWHTAIDITEIPSIAATL
jgi:hypothetical protein